MGEPTKRDQRRLDDLRAGNAKREEALTRQGVQIEPATVQALKVDVLLAMLVGDDPELQLEYEVRYQEQAAKLFAAIESQVARAKLTAPSTNGHRLLRPHGHG